MPGRDDDSPDVWAAPDPAAVPAPPPPQGWAPPPPQGWGPPSQQGWGPPPQGGGPLPPPPGTWGPPTAAGTPSSPPAPGAWGPPPPGQPPPGAWGQPAPWGQPQPWGQQPWGQQPWGQQPWGAPLPPPDPKAQRRKRLIAFGSLGAVLLLLLGLVGAVAVAENRREARVRADIERLLPGLQDFVAQQRGLPFTEPVDVEVLDDDAFLDALYDVPDGAPEPREDRDPEPTLHALGLLEEDRDLDEEVGDSLDAGVVGFYDPTTARLVLRGREVTPFVQMVLVHELTHALQDQHFDIDRPELDELDDEQSMAFTALVEGDATVVESQWVSQQPLEVQRELAEQFGGGPGESDVVDELLGFPYYAGPVYVTTLLQTGGQAALDGAYAQPPTTTEQILFPARAGAPAEVPRPEPDGDVRDEGVLGTLGLALLLDQDLFHGAAPPDLWDGDRYVTYEAGDGACTVAHIAAPDVDQLTGALSVWAQSQPQATVAPGPAGTVRLQACTP